MENCLPDTPVGDDAAFTLYLYGANNRAITTYTGSESVRARLWQGDDQADIAPGVLTLAFDATLALTGATTLSVLGSGTAALTPSYYRLRAEIQLAGGWRPYFVGWLPLVDSPGSGTVPDTYCTLQEMLDLGGNWLPKLMDESGQANFLAERAEAKSRLDLIILNHSRPYIGEGSNWFVSYGYSSPILGSELPDTYVSGLLADGKLMQTDELRRAAAYLALSLACEKAFTWEDQDPYLARARFLRAKFNQTVFAMVALFDTDSDGTADFGIPLGRFSIR
jgi:hypothetical protein